ncbi:hypothetical protein [Streptomyces marincola]|uniref:Endonuclease/Exonuclease/phosphatase family protein n=1 Tax=Streptomyces marincola TaxID=2878388 RepID=A0A1W7CSF6_9ACTN|nr:hypothetical protein [Streptomyces marincola]ARQ67743.1 hypothetical protein CAG99_01880 [Streptomyces marincola]
MAASFHLNYASPARRQAEAEWLTTFADKKWRTPDGELVTMPALMGGDRNSYPAPKTREEVVDRLRLGDIRDRPHRAHRSHPTPDGRRQMDTRPDEILHTAGLFDLAHHIGTSQALAPTVEASPTHGPATRIDALYTSHFLTPAVLDVEVIDMKGLSDHHTVLARLDRTLLIDILRDTPTITLAA